MADKPFQILINSLNLKVKEKEVVGQGRGGGGGGWWWAGGGGGQCSGLSSSKCSNTVCKHSFQCKTKSQSYSITCYKLESQVSLFL